jgi:hypothetical protein
MDKEKLNQIKMAVLAALGAGAVAALLYFADAIKLIFG